MADTLAAGATVFRQGDAPDGLYIVVSGRLAASVQGEDGELLLHELSRGHAFGEIGLITNRVRTATVRSIRGSTVLRLPCGALDEMVRRYPSLVVSLTALVVDRLLAIDRPIQEQERLRTFAVFPAGKSAMESDIPEALVAALADHGDALLITARTVEEGLGEGAADITPGSLEAARLAGWLHGLEARHRFVVYSADAENPGWGAWCLREADRVVLVGSAEQDPSPAAFERRSLQTMQSFVRRDLVLVRDPHVDRPRGAGAWLDPRDVTNLYHLRRGDAAEIRRVARLLAGRGRGLVLGGGGARGFAHLGVMQALDEAGVPIDAVGGTSIGAVMGAFYALGLDHEARVDVAEEGFLRHGSLLGFTLPLVSLTSGAKIYRLLTSERFFGATDIEDMPITFFCVSTNLSRAEAVMHERGRLADAVRASFSVPGVFPPVVNGGDLFVDGGLMNNLPVDVMQRRLDGGPIVAVDLRPQVDLRVGTDVPPALSGWRLGAESVMRRSLALPVPNILELLVRTVELGSTRAQRDSLTAAGVDLHLQPPVAGYRLLDFHAGRSLVEVGYRHTVEALEQLSDKGLL